jgi:putative IMPACT (imprinted ancient) family translation regulator
MDRIKKPTQAILEIKRSVFTADVVSMTDETLIKPYLESLKALYPKSAHITYAAFLNEGAYQKYSDDNEPKGTAGLPILEAIKYYDVTDIILTVRRDFGGILLGASGLIRAYREAAHEALKK